MMSTDPHHHGCPRDRTQDFKPDNTVAAITCRGPVKYSKRRDRGAQRLPMDASTPQYRSASASRAILITGAASGLGRAFLQYYAHADKQANIIALDRQVPSPRPPFPNDDARVQWAEVDVSDEDTVNQWAGCCKGDDGAPIPLDLVLHCAGVRGLKVGPGGLRDQRDVEASETMGAIDKAVSAGATPACAAVVGYCFTFVESEAGCLPAAGICFTDELACRP